MVVMVVQRFEFYCCIVVVFLLADVPIGLHTEFRLEEPSSQLASGEQIHH